MGFIVFNCVVYSRRAKKTKMKLFTYYVTGLLLLFSVYAWADGPTHSARIAMPDSAIKISDSALQSAGIAGMSFESRYRTPPLFRFGIKAGFNFSSNVVNEAITTSAPGFLLNPEIGAVAGPTVSMRLGDYFGLRLEALYSQTAFSHETTIDLITYTYYNRLSYADFPLILQIKPVYRIGLLFGGYCDVLLSNKYSYAQSPVSKSVQLTCQNQDGKIRNTTEGLLCGLDYMIYNRIVIGGRLTFNMPNNDAFNQQGVIVLQTTLGILF